ncbi:MAG: hypothetical protein MJA29_07325 [Candidatus Omnitrophica bacterium]|nr:hypothetical protein [Candidatus Omnitrophota bacterium]
MKADQYDRIWSIAELKLTANDLEWLQTWFKCLPPATKIEDWDNSHRQMFGSLFVCVGAELCREKSDEGSVWPIMRSILPDSHTLRRDLFLSNGQPSYLMKEIITEAARSLNLRHVMDIEGTQQWFVTIKLQFGFTYRGAKNRLSEWLVNIGKPHVISYLDGGSKIFELASDSFQSLWRALTQFRRDLIEEGDVRRVLQVNPWIKSHWIDDLLKESKARIGILGTGEVPAGTYVTLEQEVVEDEICPIASIGLKWPHGATVPRIRFRLNREAIENLSVGIDVNELDFYIDGKKLCRWLHQRDNSWSGEENIYAEPDQYYRQQPNLHPKTFVILSGSGETLMEWDLADSGLSEDVLMFDLERESIVDVGLGRLEPKRNYAVICDFNCELEGCTPVETFTRSGISRKAIRLPTPLSENLCISYEDFILWQPIRHDVDPRQRFSLSLTTPSTKMLSLNDRSQLFVNGLPEEASSASLLIHTKKYRLQRKNDQWCTSKEVIISPELAAQKRRVRVRFSLADKIYSIKPRLIFHLLGAARLRNNQGNDNDIEAYEILKDGEELNRSDGTVYLRIWVPERDKTPRVFESNCRVGLLRHCKVRLHDIPGHGGNLYIFNGERFFDLGIRCHDTGCITGFIPAMLNNPAQLIFSQEKDPKEAGIEGYWIWEWVIGDKGKTKIQALSDGAILKNSNKMKWKIHCSEYPMAVAVTYKGAWLGCWWDLERIVGYVNRCDDLLERDLSLIKWLRVPVMHPLLAPVLQKVITKKPARFIKTWLRDETLPDGLRHQVHILNTDSVVRHFLWNDFNPIYAKDVMFLFGEWCGKYQKNSCIDHLMKLSEISPILLWKGMEQAQKRYPHKIRELIEAFSKIQVGLQPLAKKQQMKYRTQELKNRVIQATSFVEERLEKTICGCLESNSGQKANLLSHDPADLLKLGQTIQGRHYLSIRLALHWLDLNKT